VSPSKASAQTRRKRPPRKPDAAFLKAISHPLRWQFLARLNEIVASPVMLAKEFGVSIPLAAYHVNILRDLDFVELVRT
jgi:hypothetical protein